MKQIIGISCVDLNGFYAPKEGGPLAWPHTEGDLDWFKYLTNGGIIVVGNKTKQELDKLPPLKNREIWAVGKDQELKSIEDVLDKYKKEKDRNLFIGGGSKIWTGFYEYYDYFYVTVLNRSWIKDGFKYPQFEELKNPIIIKDKYKVYKPYPFK